MFTFIDMPSGVTVSTEISWEESPVVYESLSLTNVSESIILSVSSSSEVVSFLSFSVAESRSKFDTELPESSSPEDVVVPLFESSSKVRGVSHPTRK